MRVLFRNEKEGEIKLLVQNLDDLWHLSNLIAPGDLIRAVTYRREEQKADKIRPERMEKVRVKLGIRIEKIEFHEFSDRLRISGKIEEGPMDLGQHHTLNLATGDAISLVKMWKSHELRRIEEAVAATNKPLITMLSIDDEEATVAQLRQFGVREVAVIRAAPHGKMFPTPDAKLTYFGEILGKLRGIDAGEAILIIGPGFEKDEFATFLRERDGVLAQRIRVHGTGQAGMAGVQEALKGGMVTKVFEDSRVAQETKVVESVLEEIAKGGKCAYGPAEIRNAVEAGAVETLLVSDRSVRSLEVEELMRAVERNHGKVLVVSSLHEAGKKLQSLGGLAALLRFKLS